MTELLVPNEMASERVALAAALASPKGMATVARLISDDDWYLPQHREIWRVARELSDIGAADFVAVQARLATAAPRLLNALTSLVGADMGAASVAWHCERIARASVARALLETTQRATQQVNEGLEPVAIAEDTITQLRNVQRMGDHDTGTVSDFIDIISRVVDPDHFVVPGLLAAGNRIVVTAPEGYGKSSLLRQIGTCTAGGVHPFKPQGRIAPAPVLIIDAENPADVNTTEYQRLANSLSALGWMPNRGMLTIDETGPINLLDGREAARLYSLVETVQPRLIIIGPLYKLHEENPNDEGPARKLSAVLDRMISISGAALVTEAHTPHNDGPQGQLLRPYGASLWKRWPDFGYCLHPVVKPRDPASLTPDEQASIACRESNFTPWRGNRATRMWPTKFRFGHTLPWEPMS